jgi:hypothetical protein
MYGVSVDSTKGGVLTCSQFDGRLNEALLFMAPVILNTKSSFNVWPTCREIKMDNNKHGYSNLPADSVRD